jgi:Holliday junction DNA helicase RuvA
VRRHPGHLEDPVVIDHLSGTLHERAPGAVTLQCGPVRLELRIPLSTFRSLPEPGATVGLWMHLVWKDDGPFLYGFLGRSERDLFRLLLEVQGVGPSGALSLLGHLPPEELVRQIRARAVEALTRVPRIGPKTAGRILIDLGPKVDKMDLAAMAGGGDTPGGSGPASPMADDAAGALAALGYAAKDAKRAVDAVLAEEPGLTLDEALRRALQRLVRPGR